MLELHLLVCSVHPNLETVESGNAVCVTETALNHKE
jgi:hypothetical protein